jgi:hypothetical protein
MKEALAFEGPVANTFIVTDNFKNYASGIFSDSKCKKYTGFNHALLTVGYGV